MPMIHPWIWGAVCCDWARKKCQYGNLVHDHILPLIWRPAIWWQVAQCGRVVTVWLKAHWSQWIA
jgi:hypothetical protein